MITSGMINSVGGVGWYSSRIAGIRRQAKAIQDRAGAESAARRAEQEKTGLIRDPDSGDMVEISSISEETRERWNHRAEMNSISPGEAYILFEASDPNAEEVERSKALGAVMAKLQDKMRAGKKLTGEEKQFLREHFPEMATLADRMEREAEQLEQKLRACESKDEARQVYMDAKTRIMSETGGKEGDGSVIFLMAALDKAYSDHLKGGDSPQKNNNNHHNHKINIRA